MRVVQVVILVIGILVSSINADTDPTDAAALRVMFTSLNSPQQLSKWTANGGDPCGESWKGITCSGSKVTEIKISGLGLNGNMGFQLASLKSVTNFDISNNTLGNEIPYQLPPYLQQLNLAGCGFTQGIPFSISTMTTLKYLNLGHNQLQGQLLDMFSQLKSLSTLDLSSNSFSGELPQSFSSLSSISNMYLQNNQLNGTINVLANLPLDNLNIENNSFSGWVPSQLKQTKMSRKMVMTHVPPPHGKKASPSKTGNGNNNSNGKSKSSKGKSKSTKGRKKKSGIGGGGIAGIVISVLVAVAIVVFFVVKRRRSRKVKITSADVEKAGTQPFPPLASHEVRQAKAIQTLSIDDTETFDTSAPINPRPPPNKFFDEDCCLSEPTMKLNTTPIYAKLYSNADLQITTDSCSVDTLVGEGFVGHVYQGQFNDGKVPAMTKINSSVLSSKLAEDLLDIVSETVDIDH